MGEYAPYDHQLLENMGRAIDLFDHLSGMIKIEQESRMHASVRAIGAGFQSVLFADPRSVEEAEECVRAVRSERPQSGGLHGVNMPRSTGLVLDSASEAWADSLDNIVIALMIEKEGAELKGVIVGLNRQERGQSELSAIQEIEKEYVRAEYQTDIV